MARKLSYSEIDAVIAQFTEVTSTCPELTTDGRRSYAYAAGALQSQLASALMDLPAHKQKIALSVLKQLTEKYSVKA